MEHKRRQNLNYAQCNLERLLAQVFMGRCRIVGWSFEVIFESHPFLPLTSKLLCTPLRVLSRCCGMEKKQKKNHCLLTHFHIVSMSACLPASLLAILSSVLYVRLSLYACLSACFMPMCLHEHCHFHCHCRFCTDNVATIGAFS